MLEGDPVSADRHLEDALGAVRETWEPKSTADNLDLIAECRVQRGEDAEALQKIIAELRTAAGS